MKNIKSNFKSPKEEKMKKMELQKNQHEIFLRQDLVLVCLHLSYL